MSGLVDHLLQAPAWVVYLAASGVVFVEAAVFLGFVVPGETAAVLAGAAAALGHVSLPVVLVVVALGATTGDAVGYAVGRRLGPAVLDHRWLARRRAALDRAADLLARRGGPAVLLGRWTAFLRAVTPALAGSARMPFRRFLLWDVIGGLLWTGVVVTVGYLAGTSYASAASRLGEGTAAAAVLVLVAAVVAWRVVRHRRSRHHGSGSDPQDGAAREDGAGREGAAALSP
ncbi:DedA family protein [uncultured Pseudokineococcus sp.]|uniref:DedA family protein n=1 Tax=uncultured Pseudokineococcus sp. TaxID=1642928 RepID=UPI0026249471|nr:DedA family protein [uncultured Pseudokineococcus sp.]